MAVSRSWATPRIVCAHVFLPPGLERAAGLALERVQAHGTRPRHSVVAPMEPATVRCAVLSTRAAAASARCDRPATCLEWLGMGMLAHRCKKRVRTPPMDLGIKGKKAIVCAASKGLGKGCAAALAREGVEVTICARGA